MNSVILWIGIILAAPFIIFLSRYITRLVMSFFLKPIDITLTTPSGQKYSRKVKVPRKDELLERLDDVIARAERSRAGSASSE